MNQEINKQNPNETTPNKGVNEMTENDKTQDSREVGKGKKTIKSKSLKKKIFIAGAVREYDSANPKAFTDEIGDYLKTKVVNPESAANISVSTAESSLNELNVVYHFGTGVLPDYGRISRQMYRCFTGECKDFVAENSIWWTLSFGHEFEMNVFFPIEDTIAAHKKNTKFYGADKYKKLTMYEDSLSLHINFKF